MAKIGKNVLENLTAGMYKESKIIYREYIQNSADQIDKALSENMFQGEKLFIDIQIDEETRRISIRDNATGVKKEDIKLNLANVADSNKEKGKDKGFRGIGRLGGLAYCEKLKFITSAKGENIKTIMTWDARALNDMINDTNIKYDASDILDYVVSYEYQECNIEDHFFQVELEGIKDDNKDLLNVKEVRKYISVNAPVKYSSKLIFKSKIYEYLEQTNQNLSEYTIYVNGEDMKKPYTTSLYKISGNQKQKYDEIFDIKIEEFRRDNGEMLAWMWYGISTFDKRIPSKANEMAGLRLRKENIQIGDENTLVDLFREERGSFYFIGEVHAVHKELIPNARRDDFNENVIRNEFEAQLKYYFTNFFHQLYHDANCAKNALKRELDVKYKEEELNKKKNKFVNDKERERLIQELENAKESKKEADKNMKKIKEKASSNEVLALVVKHLESNHKKQLLESGLNQVEVNQERVEYDTENQKENNPYKKKDKYLVDELSSLNSAQRKLVSKIYTIISNTLPQSESSALIDTIQKELKR